MVCVYFSPSPDPVRHVFCVFQSLSQPCQTWCVCISAPPPTFSDMVCDLKKLVNEPLFSDCTFIIEGRKIYSHKAILCVRAEYFQTMFMENTKEAQRDVRYICCEEMRKRFNNCLQWRYLLDLYNCKVCSQIFCLIFNELCLQNLSLSISRYNPWDRSDPKQLHQNIIEIKVYLIYLLQFEIMISALCLISM